MLHSRSERFQGGGGRVSHSSCEGKQHHAVCTTYATGRWVAWCAKSLHVDCRPLPNKKDTRPPKYAPNRKDDDRKKFKIPARPKIEAVCGEPVSVADGIGCDIRSKELQATRTEVRAAIIPPPRPLRAKTGVNQHTTVKQLHHIYVRAARSFDRLGLARHLPSQSRNVSSRVE